MPNLKDIQRKIAAVGKTRQITKAMYMVASSKLRGVEARMESFRPYATKFAEVLVIWQMALNRIYIHCCKKRSVSNELICFISLLIVVCVVALIRI